MGFAAHAAIAILLMLGSLLGDCSPGKVLHRAPSLERCIEQTLASQPAFHVVYQDVLGEGPEAWDPDPRYPTYQVNCIVWLQYVLAETFACQGLDNDQSMDAIRYFGGVPSFATRKHFVDSWLAIEPGPLSVLDSQACKPDASMEIRLDFARFRMSNGFPCKLAEETDKPLKIDYLSRERFSQCSDALPGGFYVFFGVASEKYLERWGRSSGPMAQVHGFLLHQAHNKNAAIVHHASIVKAKVVSSSLSRLLAETADLYRGFTIFRIREDTGWVKGLDPLSVDASCEQSIPTGRKDPFSEALR